MKWEVWESTATYGLSVVFNSLLALIDMLLLIVGWDEALVSWWKLTPLVKDIYEQKKEV